MKRTIYVICVAMLCVVCMLFLRYEGTNNKEITELPAIEPRVANENENYINIGFYGSLTGQASLLGQMGQLGCRLAVDQINNSGGVCGKKIRFIEYDDQSNPVYAEKVVRKMIAEDNVDAIIGSHTSGNISRTAPLTEQAQVLQIGLGTSFIWTNKGYEYLFRATGNSALYDEAIWRAICDAGHQRIAVYYGDSEYAVAGAQNLIETIKLQPNMEVVWSKDHSISQTEFREDFWSMMFKDPDAVILYSSSENAGRQLRELRETVGYTGKVYAPEAFAASTTRQEAGESLTDLVYVCTKTIPESPTHAVSERERMFLESFIRMYGTMPVTETAYRGYDAVMILAEVFRTADSMESGDLRQAMLELTDYEGINGVYDFSDASGDGLHRCMVINTIDATHIDSWEYPTTE